MNTHTLRIGIDIGSACHRVAVGLPDGKLIDEFDMDHNALGFSQFFKRISCPRLRCPCWDWRQAGPWARKMSATSKAERPTGI